MNASQSTRTESVVHLPVGAITPNPMQPRRRFVEAQLQALAESIAAQGVMQPIIVRPTQIPGSGSDPSYELVAGERRWRAVQSLGWHSVPALIRNIPDTALLETALVENLQREPLSLIEEAQSYRLLLDGFGYTQEALATRVGKERSTIANMVRLLGLPAELQNDLEEGHLTMGHARALLALRNAEDMGTLRTTIVDGGLSVRETERLVQKLLAAPPPPKLQVVPPASTPAWEAVQESLERHLATRVHLERQDAERGRVVIDYFSLDEFNRLYDLLMRR